MHSFSFSGCTYNLFFYLKLASTCPADKQDYGWLYSLSSKRTAHASAKMQPTPPCCMHTSDNELLRIHLVFRPPSFHYAPLTKPSMHSVQPFFNHAASCLIMHHLISPHRTRIPSFSGTHSLLLTSSFTISLIDSQADLLS